jgi:transcriptional regulator with XRE-family HTH domain
LSLHLKHFRLQKGLTLDQLAEVSGLSKGFLSQLETGARQPSMETINILSTALNVAEADLIGPAGFAEPGAPASMARRILMDLDREPVEGGQDFKLGTDGQRVQIIATVDRAGLQRLIKQLEAMKLFLDA